LVTRGQILTSYLNTKQACEFLGLKEVGTIYSFIREGKLKAHKLGGNSNSRRHWRIKLEDLEEFITGHGAGHAEPEESKVGQE